MLDFDSLLAVLRKEYPEYVSFDDIPFLCEVYQILEHKSKLTDLTDMEQKLVDLLPAIRDYLG